METSSAGVPAPASQDSQVPQAASTEAEPWRQAKHKVKFGGEEREVSYDELIRDYQNGKESTRRYQEAARLAKEAQTVNQALQKGDVNFLVERLGPQRAREMFENYLIEQMQYDELPPEKKELLSERKRREQLEARMREMEEGQVRARQQMLAQRAMQELDAEISEALNEAGSRANPRLALRIIEQIEANLKAKNQRIPAKEALKFAQKSIKDDIGAYFDGMSVEDAMQLLPKQLIDSLMKAKVDRVLDSRTSQRSRSPVNNSNSSEPMTIEKKFENLENKFKRRR